MARDKRDPRARRPSGCTAVTGDKMEAPQDSIPETKPQDISAVIEEQKAVIAAMNEKIKALENKAAANEAKITALSAPAAQAKPTPEQVKASKSELDKAYEKVLADLGIKKE